MTDVQQTRREIDKVDLHGRLSSVETHLELQQASRDAFRMEVRESHKELKEIIVNNSAKVQDGLHDLGGRVVIIETWKGGVSTALKWLATIFGSVAAAMLIKALAQK